MMLFRVQVSVTVDCWVNGPCTKEDVADQVRVTVSRYLTEGVPSSEENPLMNVQVASDSRNVRSWRSPDDA